MGVWDNINLTTSAGVAPGIIQYYERTLLRDEKPELVHGRDAQKKPLPLHNGKRVQFRKMTPFAAVTVPLSEGVTPAGQTLLQTQLTAMIKPYGAYVPISDELQFVHLDDMHKETARLLSDQAMLSIDTVERDAMNAGLNVQYTNSKTSRAALAATDILTVEDIRKAVRTLKRSNCRPFPDGFYHAIVHPDTVHDLTASTNPYWIDVAKYQDKSKIEKYELGTMFKVKFFESTNAKTFGPQSYVYGTTASLTATADFDVANKCLTAAGATITEDDARALTGKLVYVQYDDSGTVDTPMCIERVDAATKQIFFRWVPASAVTDNWTTGKTLKIVPSGGGAANISIFSTLIYGQNAHGNVALGGTGRNIEVIIHPPGSAGAEDPVNQRGTIAWKVKGFCSVILQDAFIVRIEHGATA